MPTFLKTLLLTAPPAIIVLGWISSHRYVALERHKQVVIKAYGETIQVKRDDGQVDKFLSSKDVAIQLIAQKRMIVAVNGTVGIYLFEAKYRLDTGQGKAQ